MRPNTLSLYRIRTAVVSILGGILTHCQLALSSPKQLWDRVNVNGVKRRLGLMVHLAIIVRVPRAESIYVPHDYEPFGLLKSTRLPDENVKFWKNIRVPDTAGLVVHLEYSRLTRIPVVISNIWVIKRRA